MVTAAVVCGTYTISTPSSILRAATILRSRSMTSTSSLREEVRTDRVSMRSGCGCMGAIANQPPRICNVRSGDGRLASQDSLQLRAHATRQAHVRRLDEVELDAPLAAEEAAV